MKKILVLVLVLCMIFSACGTTTSGDESGKQTQSSENTNQNMANDVQDDVNETESSEKEIENSGDETVSSENESVDEEVPYELRDMLPVMDGFMMYAAENEFVFNAADPEVFWGILFYTVGNYAGNSQYAEVDGDYLRVDRMFVQEYATGQFSEYDDLPEVPDTWNNNIIYDADWDAYKFARGDRGISSAEVIDWTKNEDGTYDVTARLFDLSDNQTICTVKFHLVENKYADGIANPMFLYAIDSAEKVIE